jgi:hypothetical protein
MPTSKQWLLLFISIAALCLAPVLDVAQSTSTSGSINGTVTDPTGAVVPDATVEIHNPVSHFDQSTKRMLWEASAFPMCLSIPIT